MFVSQDDEHNIGFLHSSDLAVRTVELAILYSLFCMPQATYANFYILGEEATSLHHACIFGAIFSAFITGLQFIWQPFELCWCRLEEAFLTKMCRKRIC
jgi:hypothetical protein